jgi:hypothetical protein
VDRGDPIEVGNPVNLGLAQARLHPLHDRGGPGVRRLRAGHDIVRGLHRPAGVVAEHHEQGRAEHPHAVLDAGQHLRPDDVPGGADHEEVTEAAVKDDLRGEAGVRASEDHGEGPLGAHQRGSPLRVLVGMDPFAAHEPLIARQQFAQRLVRRHQAGHRL